MKNHRGATAISDHHSSVKPKKPKSEEVSSRFLSPTSSTTTSSSTEILIQSPNSTLSPLKQKHRSSTDSRNHNKRVENSGFFYGIWPSSSNSKNPDTTLADHLGNDRLKDLEEKKSDQNQKNQNPLFLMKQRSSSEFNRFDNGKKNKNEINHKPIFEGSMRYTGKFDFSKKSSKSSTLFEDQNDYNHILPGRFSIDENASRKKGLREDSESDSNTSFETPATGKKIPASYMAPTVSSRKQGIIVSSKFMHDLSSSRSRRWSSDDYNNSPKIFSEKNGMKKGNSKWAFSPGRSGSSSMESGDSKGNLMGFSGLKPPTSPSRGKGVGNILSKGIELLKGKKSSSGSSSNVGPGSSESVHQLRLLHNRLMQWRYCNARSEVVNGNIVKQVECNFLCAWNGLTKLQHSVVQKKLQLQKEKLEMKLNYILQFQVKALEIWGNMERQHLSAVSVTKDYLHSVVCKIPLVDGAKVEPQSASVAIRHALDLATLISSTINTFSPKVEKTVGVVTELAEVVTLEKLLLEEFVELFRIVTTLEIQERSLRSSIMQLNQLKKLHHQQLYISG